MMMYAGVVDAGRRSSYDRISLEGGCRKLLPADATSYDVGCRIGTGSLGVASLWLVRRADVDDEKMYVLKKTNVDGLTTKDLENLQYELQVSSKLNHICILSFHSSFVASDGYVWTIVPLFNYGSCYDVIAAEFRHGLPVILVAMILRSVLLGLEYLHKMGFVHRAVNARYILLNSDGNICLSGLQYCLSLPLDKGVAHSFPDHAATVLPWIAPEVLAQSLCGYNDRSDIYSLGITAVELVTGTIPFSKLRATEILSQKIKGVVPQLPDKATIEELQCDLSTSQTSLDGLEQTNDMMFSPQTTHAPSKRIRNLQQFVDVCLQADPCLRPSSSQLRHCSYIRHIKRRMKEKDGPTLMELLKPLSPIEEFVSHKEDTSMEMKLIEKVPNVSLDDDSGWIF